jgi:hypothetical protein
MATNLRVNEYPAARTLLEQLRAEQAAAVKAHGLALQRGDHDGAFYWSGVRDARVQAEGWLARAFELGIQYGGQLEHESTIDEPVTYDPDEHARARQELLRRA